MSSGTNQERIEQNNLKLAQLKTKADNLPEYQDIEPIYTLGDYRIADTKLNIGNDNYSSVSWIDNYFIARRYVRYV